MKMSETTRRGRPPAQRSATAQRFADLLGEHKLRERVAELFDVRVNQMHRWEANGWPVYAELLAECLETLPRQSWPERAKRAASL